MPRCESLTTTRGDELVPQLSSRLARGASPASQFMAIGHLRMPVVLVPLLRILVPVLVPVPFMLPLHLAFLLLALTTPFCALP
mmetsp:Transcript_14884/g.41715  ORF Transcript_14884/g.41715 Transcript_14884/m.41715 type:complete len:83 (+) Transcript_14884:592-840(+)